MKVIVREEIERVMTLDCIYREYRDLEILVSNGVYVCVVADVYEDEICPIRTNFFYDW